MATAVPQGVFTVMSPVHCQAAVNAFSAAAQLPSNFNVNVNVAAASFFSRVSTGLKVVGSINIVFGCLICASDMISLANGATPSYIFSGVWSGLLFGVINGALALKASTMKPQITRRWARVNLGFGITTFILHLVPFGCTLSSLIIYNSPQYFSSYAYGYSGYYSNTNSYYAYIGWFVKNILVNDAARIVMVVVLLIADMCQLAAVSKTLEFYRRSPELAAVLVVTQGQLSMQTPVPATAPQVMYGAPTFPPASPYHAQMQMQMQPQVVYAVQHHMPPQPPQAMPTNYNPPPYS